MHAKKERASWVAERLLCRHIARPGRSRSANVHANVLRCGCSAARFPCILDPQHGIVQSD